MSQTFNDNEIEKFSALASQWWDPNGKFKILHQFTEARIDYIKNNIITEFDNRDLSQISVLDIGCGGGLVSEPLAQMGLKVTAIDASEKSINAAKIHAQSNNLNIEYIHTKFQDFFATTQKKFDVVLALEVIEHLDNQQAQQDFIATISRAINDKGLLFLSSINRNLQSLLLAKFAAEYILRWLPKNTHQYNKFVTTAEIQDYFNKNNLELISMRGINYCLYKRKWLLAKKASINYICYARKY